jgi:hypothetical protein
MKERAPFKMIDIAVEAREIPEGERLMKTQTKAMVTQIGMDGHYVTLSHNN